MTSAGKSAWSSVVTPVQPRIRLTRSYDPRSHGYQSYVLRARGSVGGEACTLSVAIGEAAHVKHGFQVGDIASGDGEPVADPRVKTAALYRRASCACSRALEQAVKPPPHPGTMCRRSVFDLRPRTRVASRRIL